MMLKQKWFSIAVIAITASMLLASDALAQVWVEVGDAPAGVPARQDTVGVGPLLAIEGSINRGQGDHTDTYSIIITDPDNFWASTKQSLGGNAITPTGGNGDTRLFLWTESGQILLGNDDHAGAPDGLASTIAAPGIFNSLTGGVVQPTAEGISLVAGEKYLISVTYFPNFPLDAAAVPLATVNLPFTGLHGPNPAAGPFNNWTDSAGTTAFTYRIALNGATFCMVPEPSSLLATLAGLLGLIAVRRR